ncbi:hypothetical protein [Marivita cryptomonadis]|jgi:hypothetical protein|uniref:hypothetical protein n=1 Tax=Marivita cryptomonadis TaxID=505252 RepID=UPI00391D72DE
MSDGSKDITVERYFNLPGEILIAARAIAGSPRRISGAGSRIKCRMLAPFGLGIFSALM